jgi:large subunit ribosomal protein L21
MDYAVIRIKGSQFKVSEKDEILVDKMGADEKIEPEVLLLRNEKQIKVGDPTVKGSKVILKNLGDEKGEKIHVVKFKSKSRYRKHIGSRNTFTRLLVESIK